MIKNVVGPPTVSASVAVSVTTAVVFSATLGVADEVIPEPHGGAHSDPVATIDAVGRALVRHLDRLTALPTDALLEARYAKFRRMGAWEGTPVAR